MSQQSITNRQIEQQLLLHHTNTGQEMSCCAEIDWYVKFENIIFLFLNKSSRYTLVSIVTKLWVGRPEV